MAGDACPCDGVSTMKPLASLLLCLGVAACSTANLSAEQANPHLRSVSAQDWESDEDDCIPELYAYAAVVSLANHMQHDRDVFDDAIADLREQLADCLTDQDGEVVPIQQRRRARDRTSDTSDHASTRGSVQASSE